ncbi:glycosyltransferase family 39 protein [Patescibacteria group bacterium]|nr:glycosyltransferase family 39 protein [Patescibacteria group bacterium]
MYPILRSWRTLVIAALFIAVLFGVSRLTNLTKLPIFTDEAIYIRWSQIGSRDANWRFISLTDGKQPMYTWILMGVLRAVHDPLLAGRLVSVGAGVGSLIGISLLTWELFGTAPAAFLAALFYVLSPFATVYDRMALYDSMVAAFAIWNLYLGILLVKHRRLDIALILGMGLGGAMLTKTSGFFGLYLLPFTLVLFDWKTPGRLRRLARWIMLVCVAALVSQAIYSTLRLSPFFHMVAEKDAVFVYPFREWLLHPMRFVEGNLRGEFDWFWRYLTLPVVGLIFLPIALGRIDAKKLLLYGWWLGPFAALALFGKVLYPRFILFMCMPLLVIAAESSSWLIRQLRRHYLGIFIVVLALVPSVTTDYLLVTNPLYAPIPEADRGQYMNDWPAGWGIAPVVSYLRTEASAHKVSVYTDGTFGLLPYAIEIYLVDNPNMSIHGVWPIPEDMPAAMRSDSRAHPTFLILNQTETVPPKWPLKLLASYEKGLNKDRTLRLFEVVPQSGTKGAL